MCNKCYQSSCYGDCGCTTCADGCPIKLDFSCILYNKDGMYPSNLDGINVPNGTTLKLVIELLDEKVKQVNVTNAILPVLRGSHQINSLVQLAESLDTEIGKLNQAISSVSALTNTSLSTVNSSTLSLSTSGTLNHTLTGEVKIGATEATNTLVAQSDGLVAVPQKLAINYTTKELSISKGNKVSLAGLGGSTWLGEVASDPSGVISGNYWYNTTENRLKIRVNNSIKEIVTV